MRILYLADGDSVHTKKWVSSLLKEGHIIHLFSLNKFDGSDYTNTKDQFTYTIYNLSQYKTKWGGLNKLSYLKVIPNLKRIISAFAPDIVHAHFASSYGLLGARSGFHPLIISVWGYDVFHFPNRSFIHKKIIRSNLSRADKILSTSHVMAKQTNIFTRKHIEVTPFGIDTEVFKADRTILKKTVFPFDNEDIVIGTAKPLEDKYAIDHLIQAFAILTKKHRELPLKLGIAGKGSAKNKLISLAQKLGVDKDVYFAGQLKHDKIPEFLNALDIFAALSLEESFGVVVIEAGACEKPVVVSDEGGLPEVVENGKTGFIIPKGDIESAADALEKLIMDRILREQFGKAGRARVKRMYDWTACIEQMQKIYREVMNRSQQEIK